MVSGRKGPGSVAAVRASISGISLRPNSRKDDGEPRVNLVQIICSIGRGRIVSQSPGTWSGSTVNKPKCSSGATKLAKSENAAGVGSLKPASGDTRLGYRRATPVDRAMPAWRVVKATQIGLLSSSKFITASQVIAFT